MESGESLRNRIIEELDWEPSLDSAGIGVAVSEGAVTLTGHVRTFAEKLTAEKAAKRVAGVVSLANDLDVRLPTTMRRDDTDIAQAAANALTWNVRVPQGVKAVIQKAWVTLEGEVDWEYQRRAAEKAIRNLVGVKGVTNRIRVTPRVSSKQVRERITGAFRRSAQIDADHVTITVSGGKVTLAGHVRSWSERAEAEHAAWAAPGVTEVINNIAISAMAITPL